MKEIKYAVQAVILNTKGEVLSVSRKDDHNDAGLLGGKVDPEDYDYNHGLFNSPMEVAMLRECREETGIDIRMDSAVEVFQMHRNGYMGVTYLINEWFGEINTDEPHVVKWVPFETIMQGTFGKWNSMVHESLTSMGVEHKLSEDPNDVYYFAVDKEQEYSDYPHVFVVSKKYWDENECISDSMRSNEYEDIRRLTNNSNIGLGEVMESYFDVQHTDKGLITDADEIEKLMIEAGFVKKDEII